MAFVKCNHCKRIISSNAHQCPFCKSSLRDTIDNNNSNQKIQKVDEKTPSDIPSQTSSNRPSASAKTNASKTDNLVSRIYLGIVGNIHNRDSLKYIADKKKLISLILIIIMNILRGRS